MTEKPRRQAIAVAVITCEHLVVASKRREDGVLDGLTEFPGGRIEPGESPEAAARRELREETGLEISALQLLTKLDYDYEDRSLSLFYFTTKVTSTAPLGEPWEWWDVRTLGAVPEANRPVVASLRQSLVPVD